MPDETTPETPAEEIPETPETPAPTPPPRRSKAPKMIAAPMRRLLAFDCAAAVDAKQAKKLYAAAYRTAIRYVDRVQADPDNDDRWPYNLTRSELAVLLKAGFDVSLVQYYSTAYESTRKGARIDRAYGERMGAVAAYNAAQLGAPEGVTIWVDAEHWPKLRSLKHARDYLIAWAQAVLTRGYEPGIYVGPNLGNERVGWLTGGDLYGLPHYRAYWRGANACPQLPRRGWTMAQMVPVDVFGLQVDQDWIGLDHKWQATRHRFRVIRAA